MRPKPRASPIASRTAIGCRVGDRCGRRLRGCKPARSSTRYRAHQRDNTGRATRGAHSIPTAGCRLRAAPSLWLAAPDHGLRLAPSACWRLILNVTSVLVLHTSSYDSFRESARIRYRREGFDQLAADADEISKVLVAFVGRTHTNAICRPLRRRSKRDLLRSISRVDELAPYMWLVYPEGASSSHEHSPNRYRPGRRRRSRFSRCLRDMN